MTASKQYLALREESRANVESDEGALYRMNRSAQAEGAFGILKSNWGFERFLAKVIAKVSCEIHLACCAFNILKYLAKLNSGRVGTHFHPLKE
ncbi:MAG: transposase [Eubacteriaceae bacterium]|nr:transposase [Eubacteriaceae bacterium]